MHRKTVEKAISSSIIFAVNVHVKALTVNTTTAAIVVVVIIVKCEDTNTHLMTLSCGRMARYFLFCSSVRSAQ